MHQITSSQNPTIKHLSKIASQKKHRDSSHEILLDGVHLCETFLAEEANTIYIKHIVFSQNFCNHAEFSKFQKFQNHPKAFVVPPNIFAKISPTKNPIGVLITIQKEFFTNKKTAQNAPRVYLDRLQDPGNIGTIMRSALAFGFGQILTSPQTADCYSPKTLRAGMGAHLSDISIHENQEFADVQNSFDHILVADMNGTPIQAITPPKKEIKTLLVLGAEGLGVSPEILNHPKTTKISIPTHPQSESLNVGIAGSICMYELSK